MRLAFGIVSLFPWGGLQRDCMRLAKAAGEQGHDVTIFTARTFGEIPHDLDVCVLPSLAMTNGGRNRRFGKALQNATAGHFDRVVGFDKIPGLDILYCGDLCFAESHSSLLQHINPRQRAMTNLEGSCFAPSSATKILVLAEPQLQAYRTVWSTQPERFVMLPPPLDPDRRKPHMRSDGTRDIVRKELGIAPNELALLCIGRWPYRKGFDRAAAALCDVRNARVLIAGTERDDDFMAKLLTSKKLRGVKDRVAILGPRSDIAELISASDLLVHVARSETAGTVILEAIVNGLPVIASSACGFASHVTAAGAGLVLPEPFQQDDLVKAMQAGTVAQRETWTANGIAYGANAFLYSGVDTALSIITDKREAPIRVRDPASERISVIVTTYNRPDALDATLRGLARQSDGHFEVVVADDGSTAETADLLKSWRARLQQPLSHVWQENRGFRAAEIRNRAILASTGRYCVFLDGDCIPRSDFVMEHRQLSEPGWLVVGNRVLMSEHLTRQVLTQHLEPESWTFTDAIRARIHGDINRLAPLLQASLGPVRKVRPQYWWGARSCNLGVWRADIDRVDGFDCSYVGWGLEDSDLLIRLLRAGVQRKDGRFSTGVLHLWHPLADPSLLSANQRLLDSVQHSDRMRALLGLSSLQSAAEAPQAEGPGRRSEVQEAIA